MTLRNTKSKLIIRFTDSNATGKSPLKFNIFCLESLWALHFNQLKFWSKNRQEWPQNQPTFSSHPTIYFFLQYSYINNKLFHGSFVTRFEEENTFMKCRYKLVKHWNSKSVLQHFMKIALRYLVPWYYS